MFIAFFKTEYKIYWFISTHKKKKKKEKNHDKNIWKLQVNVKILYYKTGKIISMMFLHVNYPLKEL